MFGPFFVGEKLQFTFTIKDRATLAAVNLTGYTAVKVAMKKDGASANKFTTAGQEDATISDAAAGKLTYAMPSAFAVGDIGAWTLQVHFTTPAAPGPALPRSAEKITFRVDSAITPTP